jgi:Ser/Thr protein kinase RdoA (MazF antagonist)
MLITEDEVRSVAALFGVQPEAVTDLGGYHNQVLRLADKGSDVVLRFTPESHRTFRDLNAEIAFLRRLDADGAQVHRPLPSTRDGWIVPLSAQDGSLWYVCCFQAAAGKTWREAEHGSEVFMAAGAALGRFHSLSKEYAAQGVRFQRRDWSENPYVAEASKVLGQVHAALSNKVERIVETVRALPETGETYGLTHGDYLFSNYLVGDGSLTIVDFDDCEFGYYVYDLAVNLFYYVLGGDPTEVPLKEAEGNDLLAWLLAGYLEHVPIGQAELRTLPVLLRLREIDLMTSIAKRFGQDYSGWTKSFMETAAERILNDVPFLPLHIEEDLLNFAKVLDMAPAP